MKQTKREVIPQAGTYEEIELTRIPLEDLIKRFIGSLALGEDLGYSNIRLGIEHHAYGAVDFNILLCGDRPETDEEEKAREDNEARMKDMESMKEKEEEALYLKLKKKYEEL